MNRNLDNLLNTLLPKFLGFSCNFVDDFLCLLLSNLGIHLTWLQFCSYGFIAGKLIYWLVKYLVNSKKSALRVAWQEFR